MLRFFLLLYTIAALFGVFFSAGQLGAVEHIRFKDITMPAASDQIREITGEILVEAKDGGLLVRADDGRIWTIQTNEMIERTSDDTKLVPIDDEAMARRMLAEMPPGFAVYRTSNYLIVHNTDELHAKQVGLLFEQLYRSFFTYWKNQDWELPEPEFPLVALVLADANSFFKVASHEIGDTAKSVIGYYSLASNRMTTFRVPDWERNIATIIHEATHQLAYNCGLQKRFADNPIWVSEGLAMFFEAPDRRNRSGWRGIGNVNQKNLQRWRTYLPKRPAESLSTLISDDSRFRSSATAADAYGEGWALTYFLIKTKKDQYVSYLRTLSEGKQLAVSSKRDRIEVFEKAFGETIETIDKQFVSYMRRVR